MYSLKSLSDIKNAIIVSAIIPENFPILNTLTSTAAQIRLGIVLKKAKIEFNTLLRNLLGLWYRCAKECVKDFQIYG